MALQVNQIVWFWRNGEGFGVVPEPAIVTRVVDSNLVDLWVLTQLVAQRPEDSVEVVVSDVAKKNKRHATLEYAGIQVSAPKVESAKETKK